MTPVTVAMNDLEGNFCCLKPNCDTSWNIGT